MTAAYRIVAIACLLYSLNAAAQQGPVRTIVLPNPQLIHCRSAECSGLWQHGSPTSEVIYPAQVLTDLVDGEVVGLTAVYNKSVSTDELRGAIDKRYRKCFNLEGKALLAWRIESEQFVISMFDGADGAKEVAYLKFGTYESHVPPAHINFCKK
jgi:hypothetical protein